MDNKDINATIGAENGENQTLDIDSLIGKNQDEYILKYASDKAPLTMVLIIINVVIWLIMMLYSKAKGLDFSDALSIFGAKENLSIMTGEYWRFVTPIFLHVNFVHLLINCYSLYYVGMITEKLYGQKKFLFIYFSAGIFGNILSFIFSPNPGAGASGSIFGLLGALLYFGVESPVVFKRYFGYNVITTIIINIAYGFSQPGIDNYAHIGGLLGGFLTSGIVKVKETSALWLKRSVFIIATIVILACSLFYGFNNNQNTSIVQLEKLDELSKNGSWVEVEKVGLEILNKNQKNDSIKFRALWKLVIAEASQGKYKSAFEHSEQIIELDASRGYYMRGLLYADTGEKALAKKDLEAAKNLDPDLTDAVDEFIKKWDE